jgi:hypothetical protein
MALIIDSKQGETRTYLIIADEVVVTKSSKETHELSI